MQYNMIYCNHERLHVHKCLLWLRQMQRQIRHISHILWARHVLFICWKLSPTSLSHSFSHYQICSTAKGGTGRLSISDKYMMDRYPGQLFLSKACGMISADCHEKLHQVCAHVYLCKCLWCVNAYIYLFICLSVFLYFTFFYFYFKNVIIIILLCTLGWESCNCFCILCSFW